MRIHGSGIIAIAFSALLVGGLGAGCSSDSGAEGTGATAVTPTPGAVALVGPAAFAATIDEPGVTVVDVRTPEEFAQGHIESAVNIDVNDVASFLQQLSALDPAATYAVYCRSDNRSATATRSMIEEGFTSVVELDGGIIAWDEAGYPVVM